MGFEKILENKFYLSLVLVIHSLVLVTVFLVADSFVFKNQIQKVSLQNAEEKSAGMDEAFREYIDNSKTTITSIRTNKIFNRYFDEKMGDIEDLNSLFFNVIASHNEIMQVRFLDKEGMERIRIDRESSNSAPVFTTKEKLQDKSHRDYFYKSKSKPKAVWFSELNLNLENKKIEVPFKPTFRAILPLYHLAEFQGIIVINYFADYILERVLETSVYDSFLIDNKGCSLKHFNEESSWSCFRERSFKVDDKFQKVVGNTTYLGDDFFAKKMSTPFENEIYLVLKINEEYITKQERIHSERGYSIALIILLFSLPLNVLFYYLLTRSKRD